MGQRSLLLRRRSRRGGGGVTSDSSDGLMDILSNVVGVMALIGSLTGIFATSSALNIQAPMQQKSSRNFVLLQAAKEGLWDLQPAVEQMVKLDRQRAGEVNRCEQLLPPEKEACDRELDGWKREAQVGPIGMSVSHANGLIRRNGPPTVLAADLKKKEGWLDQTMQRLAKEKKAVFVVLENDGFEAYRAIKNKALEYKVPIGWEPWYKDDPIYFWGNSGRNLTVQ
ncbi:hypothetical protein [Synechococcus sp. NB0720_010]|uniref:hypothetical protein n=1 Tax=Synechococcus sp. NB0720_010 TaxID=2907159 RepID=UPI001FFAC11B|nr:hypothetical protein [Synechococcus sp. NB0720_010]UPH90886.1 hypothetical protein LY254_04130 [Synechococcus sp. NB0720_010]